MQCGKCGTALEEGMLFCPKCGTMAEVDLTLHRTPAPEPEEISEEPVAEEPAAVETPVEELPVPEQKHRKLRPAAGYITAMVLIVVAALLFFAFRPKPYTSALDTFVAVFYEGKYSQIDQMVPSSYWERLENRGVSPEVERARLMALTTSHRYDQLLHCGEDMQTTYTITDYRPMTEERREQIELELGYDVKEGYLIEYELHFSGTEGKKTRKWEHYVVKIGNRWYLLDDRGSFGSDIVFLISPPAAVGW